jgi:hypothetical protein
MIQRIQSVYLLLVTILMGITAFSPLLVLREGSDLLDFYSYGIIPQDVDLNIIVKHTYGVISMAGVSAFLALINIFLYKKRKVQMKIGYLTSFFIIFFYITAGAYFYSISNRLAIDISGIQYGIVLPVIALVFNLLAISKIKKDDKLVRSLDRIR